MPQKKAAVPDVFKIPSRNSRAITWRRKGWAEGITATLTFDPCGPNLIGSYLSQIWRILLEAFVRKRAADLQVCHML